MRWIAIVMLLAVAGCGGPQEEPLIVVEPPVKADSYAEGWARGYEAYVEQAGLRPEPHPTTAYTSQAAPLDPQQVEAGYIDGYHRASESLVCPYVGAKHR